MFGWLRELYEIRREHYDRLRHCESCETLRVELGKERREKEMLLQYIITPKDWTPSQPKTEDVPMPVLRGHVPWRVRQQQLEAEDRKEKSRIMEEFRARVDPAKTEQLEKEMGIGNGEKAV